MHEPDVRESVDVRQRVPKLINCLLNKYVKMYELQTEIVYETQILQKVNWREQIVAMLKVKLLFSVWFDENVSLYNEWKNHFLLNMWRH